jgi:hypothetical protein
MKTRTSLPQPLQYLQSFLRLLAKLAPDELNEDVDASQLELALRKRLGSLDEDAAAEALSKDRDQLERWLKTSASEDHPAYWVLGYLSLPDLAQQLTGPPEPPPIGPKMDFEPPDGWEMMVVPYRLDLKRGRLWASIAAIGQKSMDIQLRQLELWSVEPPLEATLEMRPVTFEAVSGKKFTMLQTAPVNWKSVRYLLVVPGGNVSVDLGERNGADFDERPLEVQLHTLKITASA